MDDTGYGGSSETRRKRLLFRAQRRGFKEVDLVFGAYADAELAGLDEAGLDQFEALLAAPDQDVYAWLRGAKPFPAWDCLPYDRVSPKPDIESRRLATLAALARDGDKACVVVTTINALLQRVPPRSAIAGASFKAKNGAEVDREALVAFL